MLIDGNLPKASIRTSTNTKINAKISHIVKNSYADYNAKILAIANTKNSFSTLITSVIFLNRDVKNIS